MTAKAILLNAAGLIGVVLVTWLAVEIIAPIETSMRIAAIASGVLAFFVLRRMVRREN